AAIAPVRDKAARRSGAHSVSRCALHVREHVARAAGETLPARGAGTHVELESARAEVLDVLGERMAVLVAPLERDEIHRKLGHELGTLQDHVAPELHAASVSSNE